MAKGRELKGRIKTVENTRKITRTMEMVATSKMKRAQDRVVAARPYALALADVISITDGQIFLEADLFYAGVRPAVNVGISVSRVGGNAQIKAMKSVAGRLRLDLAQYRELEAFASFASDLDAATKKQLDRGARTVELLKQPQFQPMPVEQQVVVIYAVTNGFLDEVPVPEIKEWERGFREYISVEYPQVTDSIRKEKVLSKEREADLRRAIEAFNNMRGTEKTAA